MTTPPIAGVVPASVATAVHELLDERRFGHLLAAVLAVVAPHLADTPRPPAVTGPVLVDLALVQQLTRMLVRARAHEVLDPLLVTFGPYLTQPRLSRPTSEPVDDEHERLSPREREVLAGMSRGLSNGEIGRGLFLSEDTVKTHARRLFRKFGVRDRAQAVYRGVELGYLQPRRPRPTTPGETLRAAS